MRASVLFLLAACRCPAIVLALGSVPAAAAEDYPCSNLLPGPARTVVRVIDGETLALDDGSELRLVGALAPRAMDVGAEPNTWAQENRTREELKAFALGKSIELGFGGDRLDRHGKLQAQAFLIEGDQRRWVQGYVLEQGLARAYLVAGNRACADELLAAERTAREAHRGLWAEAAYQIRDADRPAELNSYRTSFQIVEGRIARTAQVRGIFYLNFNRNWRHAFSASLQVSDRAVLGAFAGNPKSLEGRRVRIRGWLEQRAGAPIVELSKAGHMEVIGDAQVKPGQDR